MVIKPFQPAAGTSLRKKAALEPRNEAIQARQLARDLDSLDLSDLRRMAGVKRPGFFGRILNSAGSLLEGIKLALAIAPTLGHTILAKEISQIQASVKGEEPKAPLDWLREHRPSAYLDSIGTLLAAGSGPMQKTLGLSATDLATVQEHFYRNMAPVTNNQGEKSIAPFLKEIARRSTQEPGQAAAGFVFLGEELKDEAAHIMELWNADDRPPTNPFPKSDQRSIIWNRLETENGQGKLPIFVDIDGDYSTFTGTEFVGKTTLASLGERNNRLGDDFADSGVYFAWLATRQESHSQELMPYLQKQAGGELAPTLQQIRTSLTPPWLDGPRGMVMWPAVEDVKQIPEQLDGLREKHGKSAWADALVSLDRDVLTGVQTYWIKLLRELPRQDRQTFLEPLAARVFEWNLRGPDHPEFAQVAPPDAPTLTELQKHGELATEKRPYDRAVALQDVLDHTLDGLGIAERRKMIGQVREAVVANRQALDRREHRLRDALGSSYTGLQLERVIDGSLQRAELKKGLEQLQAVSDASPRSIQGQEARRHADMLKFLYRMEQRYGEVDQILNRLQGNFGENPLGISEFFIPPTDEAKMTPMRQAAQVPLVLGNRQDPNPIKISQVLEGGGGRGFAYPEALKQLEHALADSQHGYQIDEFIGTSAGSMPAALLAAGFKTGELREVMESIDFKAFNADAVWMMGGVDPKVRGVERNGLFSTQMMYLTFQKILSEKLGIEGRPVLFRDLPHKLKVVGTVLNTDLPENDPMREHIDGDGRLVFSSETTPNFDVAGALAASAAVPFFFQSPQILVARPGENGQVERSRIQLADGGTVDNLSTSSANTEEEKRTLMVLPVHTRTQDPKTGVWTSLDTLNFDSKNLDVIDEHNRKLYSKFAPKLDEYLQGMKAHGVERAVLGFNLASPSQQPLPALQGNTEELSLKALIHADAVGFQALEKDKGDSIISFSERPPSVLLNSVAGLFDRYVDDRPGEGDGRGDFHRDEHGFHYHPSTVEEADLFDLARAAGGAALSAGRTEHAKRRFEKS